MTKREERIIRNYILKAEVEHMEFYEELYDHIASSFANRSDSEQGIEQHLDEVISPEFGGAEGIEEMVRKESKILNSAVYKLGWKVFYQHFATPIGLLKTITVLGILYLLRSLNAFSMVEDLGALLILVPYGCAGAAKWQFKRKCKAQNLAYRSSVMNSTIFSMTSLIIVFIAVLLPLFSKLILGKGFYPLEYLSQFEFLTLPLTLLLALYAITCFTLIQKKVRLNPLFN